MNLWQTALLVAAAVAATVGLFLFARRFAPAEGFFVDGDRAAGVFGVLATGFAVLLGFVIFLAFESYDTARAGAQAEATLTIQQFETAQLFPRPVARRLGGELICYGRAVVALEWPSLVAGREPGFNPWGIPLFRTLQTAQPTTSTEQAAYEKWLDQTSAREQSRLDRVRASGGAIPTPLWVLLLVAAALVFLYAFLFADPREGRIPQAVIVGTITALLGTSLLVIRFLNHPYAAGSGGLRPAEMARVLAQIDRASAALDAHPRVPCDAAGRPR